MMPGAASKLAINVCVSMISSKSPVARKPPNLDWTDLHDAREALRPPVPYPFLLASPYRRRSKRSSRRSGRPRLHPAADGDVLGSRLSMLLAPDEVASLRADRGSQSSAP